jgi:hypothetical protein
MKVGEHRQIEFIPGKFKEENVNRNLEVPFCGITHLSYTGSNTQILSQ